AVRCGQESRSADRVAVDTEATSCITDIPLTGHPTTRPRTSATTRSFPTTGGVRRTGCRRSISPLAPKGPAGWPGPFPTQAAVTLSLMDCSVLAVANTEQISLDDPLTCLW